MNQSCAVSRSRAFLLVRCLLYYPAEHGVFALPAVSNASTAAFFRQIFGDVIMSEQARDVGSITRAFTFWASSPPVQCAACHVMLSPGSSSVFLCIVQCWPFAAGLPGCFFPGVLECLEIEQLKAS